MPQSRSDWIFLILMCALLIFPSLAWSASSESIRGVPIGSARPADACADLKYDIMTIARAKMENEPKEQLTALANRSLEILGQERLDRILAMIEEFYAFDGPIVDLMNRRYAGCRKV